MQHVVFDTEVFSNVFLFVGKVVETGEIWHLWHDDELFVHRINRLLKAKYTFVSFNGIKFDMPVIAMAASGAKIEAIKALANHIIEKNLMPWDVYRSLELNEPKCDHIDLFEVAPGVRTSLKTFGARMNMPKLQDMPFAHDAYIYDENRVDVFNYCLNDVETTAALFKALRPEIELRMEMGKEYGCDFRSKSDAQVAETAFIKRLNIRREKNVIPKTITYAPPKFILFSQQSLKDLLKNLEDTIYDVHPATGHIIFPQLLDQEVAIGEGSYQIGIGGLHSTHDVSVLHQSAADYFIVDIDATSFYPKSMLNAGMVPKNTGERFIKEFELMVNRRIAAKYSGDEKTSLLLKTPIVSIFGKTSEKYSPFYSPDLTLATTLTGQLVLLSLIEHVTQCGANVLSANTDGIVVGACAEVMRKVSAYVKVFEQVSNFDFEYTHYKLIAMKDVNNYIAITSDGKLKQKGIYAPQSLKKNPTAQICSNAVSQWLLRGVRFEQTLSEAKDIKPFLSARNAKGGASQDGKFLGKSVRWYASTDKTLGPIQCITNENKVAKTDGCRAAMDITDSRIPADLDYEWYLKECIEIAKNIGATAWLSPEDLALVAPPPKQPRKKKVKND